MQGVSYTTSEGAECLIPSQMEQKMFFIPSDRAAVVYAHSDGSGKVLYPLDFDKLVTYLA